MINGNINYSRYTVAVYFFFCGLLFSSWASRIPTIKEAFGLNEAELGAVLVMLPLGSFIALPIAGWAVHKVGSRWMTMFSCIGYALMLYVVSIGSTVFMLSLSLFFFGFMGDLLNIAMNTQGLDVQHRYKKPILSSFHGMWSLGALAGALVGGWTLKRNLSTTEHFLLIMFGVIIISLLLVVFLIKADDKEEEGKKLFVMPDKALWLIGMICFCCALCEGAMADWSALYYKEVINDPGRVSTTGFTFYIFAMALGRFSGDRLLMWLHYRRVLMLDSLLIAGGLTLALAFRNPILVIAGFALVGFGVSTVIPIAYMLAGKSKTMKASVALAAVSTIGFTGFLIGPPIIGFIAHQTGLRIALLLVLLMGLFIYFLSRRIKVTGI
jgi:MFS family permease